MAGKRRSALTAETAGDALHYEPDFKVLICKEHRYAVRNLDQLLRDAHLVTAKDRRAIVEKYAGLALARPEEVQLPPPLEPPLDALGRSVDALLCAQTGCGFISVSADGMRKHCKREHGLGWSRRKEAELALRVKAQSFFPSNGLQRYFTVSVLEGGRGRAGGQATGRREGKRKEEVGKLLAEWRGAEERHEREMQVMEAEVAKQDRTGWFNRTGWPEHLARCNLRHLSAAAALPGRDERALQQAAKAVDALIERSVAGLSTLGLESRRWLRSVKREEAD
ncbi:hypothetical protein B0J12DRAFT_746545 [Macrophomina phaseolina]|uniref:Uncharacterized protein n=1 Tax=Macrophomina phaseolina TaxID=35725 RepID=A0ABQ8FS67_9PEZI|nr:hypothetical protein B0J12DRAFT_746545 [Macrophomina phaseolina]